MGLDDKTFPAKYVLGAISREKDKMVSAEEMLDRAERNGDIRALHIARLYCVRTVDFTGPYCYLRSVFLYLLRMVLKQLQEYQRYSVI